MVNNQVVLIGKVASDIWGCVTVPGICQILIEVERTSGQIDVLPVHIPDQLITDTISLGDFLTITGEYRSRNQRNSSGAHLQLYVRARELRIVDTPTDCTANNQIHLQGYICKKPIYRKTPKGREIADLILAVNRETGGTDYIPCIAWGATARFTDSLEVGNLVAIDGRLQSRKYIKRINDITQEERTAYEVSGNSLTLVAGDDKDEKGGAEDGRT